MSEAPSPGHAEDLAKRPQFGTRLLQEIDDVYKHNACGNKTYEHTRKRKKPGGGGDRILTNVGDVFKFNAWDHVEWDAEQEEAAQKAVAQNSGTKMSEEQKERFQTGAAQFWDSFYGIHDNRFFKDRHWLFTEFPELAPINTQQAKPVHVEQQEQPRSIFELGCGVGNTIMPLLQYCTESKLKVYGCDFSSRAIEILQRQQQYIEDKRCEVFVMDATLEHWKVPFEEDSQDIIVMIFVLSAIEPHKMQRVIDNCYRYLKPGGLLLFRDYGRYDLAQLRFKNGKCLEDNFYVRGDGTMVYFFTEQELREMLTKAGLQEEQLIVDRRLQVNRGRCLKMYRVWIQTKFRKPL